MSNKNKLKIPSKLTIMAILVGCAMAWSSGTMVYLKHYGIPADGIVTSVHKVGSKGKYSCHYEYFVNERTYHDNVQLSDLSEGDLITVLYYHSSYLHISAPEKFIEKHWGLKEPSK